MTIADIVRGITNRYSREWLADRLSVSTRTVRRWENGKVAPKLASLNYILLLYGVERA